MNCSKCGAVENGAFCSACGAPLLQLEPQPLPVTEPVSGDTLVPVEGSAKSEPSDYRGSNERPGSMFNPFARHSWDAPPKSKQSRAGAMSFEAATKIFGKRPAPDEGVVSAPITDHIQYLRRGKMVAFVLLGLAVCISVGIFLTRPKAVPYVNGEDRNKAVAEKVCFFPAEAITSTDSADATHPDSQTEFTLTQVSYVTSTGNHVATVTTDLASVDRSAVEGSSNVQTCG